MRSHKISTLRNWFKEHVKDDGEPYRLDSNQSAVILDTHKNCLVTARAGSGKTRTVVAKIIYLLAHEHVNPEEIIVFAFNRKARTEINQRLTKITVDGKPLFERVPEIATTFHAFAFRLLNDGGLKKRLISESFSNKLIASILTQILKQTHKHLDSKQFAKRVQNANQFITRAEQLFFEDYNELHEEVNAAKDSRLRLYYRILTGHHNYLAKHNLLNFNQMLVLAAEKLQKDGAVIIPAKAKGEEAKTRKPYRYIFIDEYQDFSLLFLKLIQALRSTCPDAHLLAVGDDWQAINGFAGSDVHYFQHFERYFAEDFVKLFIPTNYRSGRQIVRSANYFMANSFGDYKDCKAGNKTTSSIHLVNLRDLPLPPSSYARLNPYAVEQMYLAIQKIVEDHPGQSVKVLSRNNELNSVDWTLDYFCKRLGRRTRGITDHVTYSTIHRSKGLEADVVILLEIDAGKFPKKSHDDEIFSVFNETAASRLADEERLFYVALTRAKKELYIFTSTPPQKYRNFNPKKPNFLELLNPDWLDEFTF